MIKQILILSAMALAAGCATNKYHDREKDSSRYQEGTGIAVSDTLSVGGTAKTGNLQPAYSSSDAVGGLIESAISLAAYPNYYKPSSVSGTCFIGEGLSRVDCRHVKVELINHSGKSAGVTTTNDDGKFAFYVKKGERYHLKLADERFELASTSADDVVMGANVILIAKRR